MKIGRYHGLAGWLCAAALLPAAAAARADLAAEYLQKVRPVLAAQCYDCHSSERARADLNLERFFDLESVQSEADTWQHVLERVQAYEMPPKSAGELNYNQFQTLVGFLRRLPKPDQPDCNQLASDRTASYYRGYVMSRRLNRAEYLNTVGDLFGVKFGAGLAELLPTDGGGGEGFDTTGDTLFTSPIHIERYLAAAEWVTHQVLPDRGNGLSAELLAARERVLFRKPGAVGALEEAAREVLGSFARRAWRRPIAEEELDALMGLFERAAWRGEEYAAAVRLAVQGILISPHFLFLAEPEPPRGGVQRLADVPLASKLSYFLWSSMPDDELLGLAERGRLADPRVYREQIRRMLDDPKAAALGTRFALQWLELDGLGRDIKPDAATYPEFDAELAAAMKGEVASFFHYLVREDRSLLELLDSRHTFVNARLAELYGLEAIQGDQLRLVELTDARRGGLLGMAAVHAVTSYPMRTSPVLRGRWVIEALLGERIPPPPPDVPALYERAAVTDGLSLRQQLELHRLRADCAACHDRMDPLGFGLENYDVLGRWRDDLAGLPLDTQGTLPSGEVYEGPTGLKQVLLDRKDRILRHLSRKLTGFAFGRELNRFDNCVIDDAMRALEAQDWRVRVLIETIATSYPFQYRFHPLHHEPDS